MSTPISPDRQPTVLTHFRKVVGKSGEPYEIIFVNRQGCPVVPLTEWYQLRKAVGPSSTRATYLAYLMPFLSFLEECNCPWNAPPEQLRPHLLAFYRNQLSCHVHPGRDGSGVEIIATRETPLRPATLQVFRAALRDFYLVLKDAGLYAFANPLSSEVLVALKREYLSSLANRGAPDYAGIREETHERSRRRPTAFVQYPKNQEWKPEVRRELTDVREGIHTVLNTLLDSNDISLREKAILELLQTTGARLHEITLLTVGGYRNDGIAGQARVVNKGSYGREIKTIYFAHNPKVEQTLTEYLEQVRPLHDQLGRRQLLDLSDQEPLFLTERGTAYSPKAFYWHWYRHYTPVQSRCPVRFSPHAIRHLFITEFLIRLKMTCTDATNHFDEEAYLQAREAFASLVMGWSSIKTIDLYDHSRNGERALAVLANYQHDLSHRSSVSSPSLQTELDRGATSVPPSQEKMIPSLKPTETIWLHDTETLIWVNKFQQQKGGR